MRSSARPRPNRWCSACASGKHLTTIYISHGDPDYYFGLDTLTQAFPDAKVLASAATVAHIRKTMDAKLAYWGPQMGADKPASWSCRKCSKATA
jgi:glyoxylase-like metal-dependent hydrolase (beta-lactamase superfamily II)